MHIPKYIRQQIADIVQSVIFITSYGGSCVRTARLGQFVLGQLGIDCQLVHGSLTYRAGRHVRHTLVFGHPETRRGMIRPDGFLWGHTWLRSDADTIDFSPANWIREDERTAPVWGVEPIRWAYEPPQFIWQATSTLPRWHSTGYPRKGEYWYGPWVGPIPDYDGDSLEDDYRDFVEMQIEGSGLREAIMDLQTARIAA